MQSNIFIICYQVAMINFQKLFFQNIFWRGLFYVTGFLLNVLIARHFEAAFSGFIYYLINGCSLLTLIGSLSIESGIIFFSGSNQIAKNKLFYFSITWTSVIGMLFLLTTLFGASSFSNSLILLNYKLALLFITGNILSSFISGFFSAEKNFTIPSLIGTISNLLLIGLIFFINKDGWLSNQRYLFFYFSGFLFQGVLLLFLLLQSKKSYRQIDFISCVDLKKLFTYVMIVFISNIISFFVFRVDYWFVHHYCSIAEVGNYIQVSKLVQLFFVLPAVLAAVVFPLTSSGHDKKINEILPLLSRMLLLAYAVICMALIIFGNWLFPFVFGNSFNHMYQPYLFYIPGILGMSALYTLTSYYAGKNKVIVNIKGCFYSLLIILLGDFLLIPKYGITAAAGVSSCGYLFYFGYVLNIFVKEYKVSLKDFFYFKKADIYKIKNILLKK